ncbi:MAG: hypothetical protein FJW31_16405 [Acidobacteria bacterium]|nr:hypothetical protein [Acidobacteriota bacterium]
MSNQPAPSHCGPKYETTDANIKAISVWTIGIFVTILAGMIAVAAMLFGLGKFPVELERKPTAAEYERTVPSGPRLQVDQAGDLDKFRRRENEVLNNYGRQPNSGAVRIPVDTAIDIVAGRGVLPGARPAAAAAAKTEAPKPVR